MKNKLWIIILIMGIALTISLVYSVIVSHKKANGDHTITTTSIIEMTATTVTIKNTLSGTGVINYLPTNTFKQDTANASQQENNVSSTENNSSSEVNEVVKSYQIILSVDDKDVNKIIKDQETEISVKNNENSFQYKGKVIDINKESNNKSTIKIEVLNPDNNIQEKMEALCTLVLEKAENVVALPIEAVQIDEANQKYVDIVLDDGTTKKININTGISDDYYVEITSGLKVGDRVQIIKSSTTVVENKKNKE